MQKQIGDIRFYDVDELVEVLEINKQTIFRYIKNGELIASKIGQKYWITENMLRKFLETPHHRNRPSGEEAQGTLL